MTTISNLLQNGWKSYPAQPSKRKAEIIKCQNILDDFKSDSDENRQEKYFSKVQQAIIDKHRHHHTEDSQSGINVSFGVVRLANITPCVALAKYLIECDWPNDIDIKIMAYHSRQVLLLRHEQEKHLDGILKRKEKQGSQPAAFKNDVIRAHLDNSSAKDMLFILVATPVEEVGRDHDFDWAIVEPSSYRSIIQLAGRVRRHRRNGVALPTWLYCNTTGKRSKPGISQTENISVGRGMKKSLS